MPFISNLGSGVGYAVCVDCDVVIHYENEIKNYSRPEVAFAAGEIDLTNDSAWLRMGGSSPTTEV